MRHWLFTLLALILLTGCNGVPAFWEKAGGQDATDNGEVVGSANGEVEEAASGEPRRGAGRQSMAASPFESPKDMISHQYVLLRNGATEELKPLFTERVRDEITPELVEELRKSMAPVSMRDLVNEVIEQEIDGKTAAIIKRKDGSTLTTLIKTGEIWQADTIWFK